MRHRTIRIGLAGLVILLSVVSVVDAVDPVAASHHREAPLISLNPKADITDVYAFLETDSPVTTFQVLVLSSLPFDPDTFGIADTILEVDGIAPGMGAATLPIILPRTSYRSSQPLTVGYANGMTEQFDVKVRESDPPATGTLSLLPNPEGTGGVFFIDLEALFSFEFTSRQNGRVVNVDMAAEGIPPVPLEGSGSYSYLCPAEYLTIPGVTPSFCPGHDPTTGDVLPFTLFDVGQPSDPRVVLPLSPAPALPTTNQPPVFNEQLEDQDVVQGETLFGTVSATDPEMEPVTFSLTGPAFCMLENNGDSSASFECDTTGVAPGRYTAIITATDGVDEVSQSFDVIVKPVVDAGGPYSVFGGQTVQLSATGPAGGSYAWDLDGDGTFETPGQTVTFDPAGRDLGPATVTVRVVMDDPELVNTDAATVNVLSGPNAPTIQAIPDGTTRELFPIFFEQQVKAEDIDGDKITLTATVVPEAFSCTFTDNGDGTGVFSCTNAVEAGEYTITITASDGANSSTETFKLTVEPAIEGAGPYFVPTGSSTTITPTSPSATEFSYDADGDGAFEAEGPSYVFDAFGLVPGTYIVTIKGCLPGGEICTLVDGEVIVQALGLITYDQLRSLTRDAVDSFFVERTLTTMLNLAEFFDDRGADRAARALLEAFVRFVESLAGSFIDEAAAQLMIEYAESIMADLPE